VPAALPVPDYMTTGTTTPQLTADLAS